MSLKKDPKIQSKSKPLNYREAGVNVAAGNRLVDQIKHITKRTSRPEVLSDLGGFGGLCEIPKKYDHPVLVSATDGVGTKLKLAMAMKQHETIGIDLVAMCVNDLIVCGAEPLFFLDYYATGRLDVDNAQLVIKGIGEGCEQAGCALIGGETAEMPGMYHGEDYDLAGFAVGVVEKTKIIDQSRVSAGDTLIGLHSSGPHSNGYSLIRKIIEVNKIDIQGNFGESTIGEALLSPTLIYVKALNNLLENINVHAVAHITGGGLIENVPRVLPENTQARIELSSWELPPIFSWLQDLGDIEDYEMHRTFNCGIGMIICIASEDTSIALEILAKNFIEATTIGKIIERPKGKNAITLV